MLKKLFSSMLIALLTLPATAQINSGSAPSGAAPTTLVGCVQKTGDVYTLNDETWKITSQLRGVNLKNGRHVQVIGTTVANASPTGGATQVLDVTSVKSLSGSCRDASSAGASYAGNDKSHRGKIIGAAVMAVIVTGIAVEVVSRQGAGRGGK